MQYYGYTTTRGTILQSTATAVRIWNSLLQHITSAPSLHVFCSRCYP